MHRSTDHGSPPPCRPACQARSRRSHTSLLARPTWPPAKWRPSATRPWARHCSTRPPTPSCAASPSAASWPVPSPRRAHCWPSCSCPPSPPSPQGQRARGPMKPQQPKAAALPRPKPTPPQRPGDPAAANRCPPYLTDTEGITAMTGPITRHRDIESLETAARWPGADRNTTVILAARLAAARADGEGYRYFSGLAVAALPPDRQRAEQAVADLEFVLAVRDQFPAILLRAAYHGLAASHAVLGHDEQAAEAERKSGLSAAAADTQLMFGGFWATTARSEEHTSELQ